MGRRKKDETAKLETEKSKNETADSGNAENVGATETNANQEEFRDIMSAYEPELVNNGGGDGKEPPEVVTENADEEFIPKRERKKRESKEEKKTREESERRLKIPGYMVNKVTNRIYVGVISWLDNKFSKHPIPAEMLYMDDDEMKEEENVAMAEDFIKALNLTGNPILLYLAGMAAFSVGQYMMIRNMVNAEMKNRARQEHENKTKQEQK